MCLIIHKPDANTIIPEHILNNAEKINPDGFGIVYTDNNECCRTMDYNQAYELIIAKRPFVAHYRYATRGTINKGTCHPYHVKDFIRLFSNGTVADLGDKQLCDTYVVADMLKRIPKKYWKDLLSMTETRFAITYPDGSVERHGNWHEKDGVFYSKNNCFHTKQSNLGYHYNHTYTQPYKMYEDYWDTDDYVYDKTYDMSDTSSVYTAISQKDVWESDPYDWEDVNLIAVYGTLKAGYHNNSVLGNSSFIGAGKTVNKYAMQAEGIPYVYEHEHRDQISVEVYEIDSDNTKISLDNLESHPDFYQRKLTDIELTDGSVRTCWLYFAQRTPSKNMDYIQTY